eukprot:1196393-Rhodomonas_salina.3
MMVRGTVRVTVRVTSRSPCDGHWHGPPPARPVTRPLLGPGPVQRSESPRRGRRQPLQVQSFESSHAAGPGRRRVTVTAPA